MARLILGTAGHVDHGKTALVRALTGIDTDRLPEEKARGITTELGFAHLTLPEGETLGVVDVPGHENFVKAMAAGAGGVDLALLAVALDEGVKPQTREHLDICRLLGVRAGVLVVTKLDLAGAVGAGRLVELERDLRALVAGGPFAGAPLVAVSAHTGEGLDQLLAAIAARAGQLAEPADDGPLYLPIDRAFTLRGFGTVVTGTLLSGSLRPEESLLLLPAELGGGSGGPHRVRGVQVHGRPVAVARAGERTAVNLAGVEIAQLSRGLVLTRPGEVQAAVRLDVRLEQLPSAGRPLRAREKLVVHLGTASAEAELRLLGGAPLAFGETGFGQLQLARPLAVLPGQRFLLRGFETRAEYGRTVGGGQVLAAPAPRRKPRAPHPLAALGFGDPSARVAAVTAGGGEHGLTPVEAFAQAGLSRALLAILAGDLAARGELLLIGAARSAAVSAAAAAAALPAESSTAARPPSSTPSAAEPLSALRWLAPGHFAALVDRAVAQLPLLAAAADPGSGVSREALRAQLAPRRHPLPEAVAAAVLAELERRGLATLHGDRVLASSAAAAPPLDPLDRAVAARLAAAGLAPPALAELAQELQLPAAQLAAPLRRLIQRREVVRVTDQFYFARGPLDDLRRALLEHLRLKGTIAVAEFKALTGGSRKFAIPLSEFFDRERLTLRRGEVRVLWAGR